MVRRMQTGLLRVTDSKGTVSTYAVASRSELIAIVDGVAFHFHTPEYPPPPRVPDDKNIEKMSIHQILEYLQNRLSDEDYDD